MHSITVFLLYFNYWTRDYFIQLNYAFNLTKKKNKNKIYLSLHAFDNLSSECLAESGKSNVPEKLPFPNCDSASSNLSAMSNICPVV